MDDKDIAEIGRKRSIGIIAHIDAGKTTTTELILYKSGEKNTLGTVDTGNTSTDSMSLEKEKGITIRSANVSFNWKLEEEIYEYNLIDTPGHVDFAGEVVSSLRAINLAVCVIDSSKGVEAQTLSVIKQCTQNNIPVIFYLNKMDKLGADFEKAYKSVWIKLTNSTTLVESLNKNRFPVIVTIPVFREEKYVGLIDLVRDRYYTWKGDNLQTNKIEDIDSDNYNFYKKKLIEELCEIDATYENGNYELITKYTNGEQIDKELIINILRRELIRSRISLVLNGSSQKGIGVESLLDWISYCGPSPLDVVNKGYDNEENEIDIKGCEEGFIGFVFKIVSDQHLGSLAWVKICRGVLVKGKVKNIRTKEAFSVGRIYKIFADKKQEISSCKYGDIVAIPVSIKSPDYLIRGDTILDNESVIIKLKEIKLPDPLVIQNFYLEDYNKNNEDRLNKGLDKILLEDPTVKREIVDGFVKVFGQGKLHLDIIRSLAEQYTGLKIKSGAPIVQYKETFKPIRKEFEYVLKKQSGGHGSYAKINILLESGDNNSGIVFIDKIRGQSISRNNITAVNKGIITGANSGGHYGYSITDFKVTLIDGAEHCVDSSDKDFSTAASLLIKEIVTTLGSNGLMLLEPFVIVTIEVPTEFTGVVHQLISSKRGIVLEIKNDTSLDLEEITFNAPLSETFNLVDEIRSITKGRGTSSTPEFLGYFVVSDNIIKKLIKT